MTAIRIMAVVLLGCVTPSLFADELADLTSLSDKAAQYELPDDHYVVLQRGEVTAVIVDNEAVDNAVVPVHRAGYSGLASLTHARRNANLFVPAYAGLNFEHIHDGSVQPMDVMFEPRRAPMQLRRIDEHTVDLYQAPTPTWKLESCTRYRLLPDGTIEMIFECIPHAATFRNGYIGLFWASYINRPESLDIHFKGHAVDETAQPARWIRGITPKHGEQSTHLASNDQRTFAHDDAFPLTLVFNRSGYRYSEPWYFGVSHGLAFVQMFRPMDEVRMSQSPSGGGNGKPAWDFQFMIRDYKIGQRYQMIMRAGYIPYESNEQVEQITQPHRRALMIGQ